MDDRLSDRRRSLSELLQAVLDGVPPRPLLDPGAIEAFAATSGIDVPADLRAVLVKQNGFGLYGFKSPFIVYSLQEIAALWREQDLYVSMLPHSEVALVIGGDGGGILYFYDLVRGGLFAQYEQPSCGGGPWPIGATIGEVVRNLTAGLSLGEPER